MNTTQSCENYRETIAALRDGRFDAIQPDQMAAAETHMNGCAACRSALTDVTPIPEPQLCETATLPADESWKSVWDKLDESAATPNHTQARILRFVRPWGTLAAAAVVMLMVSLWRMTPATDTDDWAFQLAVAGDVEIESMEVFGDSTSMLMSFGDDDISIIWVMDDEGV
ncbi:MAG: hypothetical protein IID33_02520 [Planctomycetes bacterium]|nr:hypothetical protein [Planctomycetota bacterium]